jgi:tRNA (guanine-N7-)-methyltransferase
MGRKNKLWKFQQLATFENVYENFKEQEIGKVMHLGSEIQFADQWNVLFGNNNPVVLELACGKGEYTVQMAIDEPEKNFIGVDVKGARIWKGARRALDEKLKNALFLRTRIELLDQFIPVQSISEIWITFPDPFLKESKSNRRLTYHRYLDLYKRILINDGKVHLKTDSPELYEFTLESLRDYGVEPEVVLSDIYSGALPDARLEIKTYYERMHLEDGRKIKYVKFGLQAPKDDFMKM